MATEGMQFVGGCSVAEARSRIYIPYIGLARRCWLYLCTLQSSQWSRANAPLEVPRKVSFESSPIVENENSENNDKVSQPVKD